MPKLPFPDNATGSQKINIALLDGTAYAHHRKPSAVEYRSLFNCLGINSIHIGTKAILDRVYAGEMIIFWQQDMWNFADVPDDFVSWLKALDVNSLGTEDNFSASPVPPNPSGSTMATSMRDELEGIAWDNSWDE